MNETAGANPVIKASGIFCVNILAKSQTDVSNVFASNKAVNRFEHGEWDSAPYGAPRLIGAAASFDCRLMDTLPGFLHNIFIGLITGVVTSDAAPLLYAAGEYGHFAIPTI